MTPQEISLRIHDVCMAIDAVAEEFDKKMADLHYKLLELRCDITEGEEDKQ